MSVFIVQLINSLVYFEEECLIEKFMELNLLIIG